MLTTLIPLAYVIFTSLCYVSHFSMAMTIIILEITFVDIAIRVDLGAFAVRSARFPMAFVSRTVRLSLDSIAMFQIIYPHSGVNCP